MKYEVTEEMVMREFKEGEIPYRCGRIETWIEGDNYAREVGHIRVPAELFDEIRNIIEKELWDEDKNQ